MKHLAKTHRTVLLALITTGALGALAGCMASQEAVQVQSGEFTFQVDLDGSLAVARNYHTGRLNFAQLEEAARSAIETASGCAVRTLSKRGEINTFDATLDCAA